MTLVVDASIAVKWIFPEPDSARARDLLERDEELLAPDFLLVEVGNALWGKCQRGQVEEADVHTAMQQLRLHGLDLHPMHTLVTRALELGLRLEHPIYDCLYLALAEQEATTVITADRRLASTVAGTAWASRVDCLVA